MSKKNSIKKAAALALGLALTVGATGCNFIRTDNAKDLAQTVASVNIAGLNGAAGNADDAKKLNDIFELGGISKDIPKRDLISYFMNVGYTYVQNYGYSYTDTFNMLLDTLISRKIVTQYAILYYLNSGLTVDGCRQFIESEESNSTLTEKEKALLKDHPEVSALKYFLTSGGTEEGKKLFDKTLYQMNASINASIDSAEENYITATDEEHNHAEARTMPTSVGVEKDDFYIAPKTDANGEVSRYEVYTGLNKNGVPYGYEALDGSTVSTRLKAYNAFVGNLDDNGLIKKGDNTASFSEMDYYYIELASRLEQALITKYTDDLIAEGENELSKEYLQSRYQQTYEAQKIAYDADNSAFETALDSLSESNFVTYSPVANYGFVYNILIPFSEEQNRLYSAEEARSTDDADLYKYRTTLLAEVQAKDLRTTWFDEHDHANYAFDAAAAGVDYYSNGNRSSYLFFEDNLTDNDRYEELSVYLGLYPFNGKVTKGDDGAYKLKPNVMGIDEFLGEMEDYITYAVGAGAVSMSDYGMFNADGTFTNAYVSAENGKDYKKLGADGTFKDYSEFVYYSGKINVDDVTAANYFNPETKGYKAAAAFNELMFAYSTDPGCLNTYMGYVVSPFTTSYVGEFEYAAQWAVKQGPGTYVVCPSTYGWHIIYVTYTYAQGDVYGGYNESDAATEGTFSNFYATALKEQYSANYANNEQTRLILEYDNDTFVERNQKTYQDLLDLDK